MHTWPLRTALQSQSVKVHKGRSPPSMEGDKVKYSSPLILYREKNCVPAIAVASPQRLLFLQLPLVELSMVILQHLSYTRVSTPYHRARLSGPSCSPFFPLGVWLDQLLHRPAELLEIS